MPSELAILFEELETNPTKGTHLGNSIYKIRMPIASKGKGKSGGARIMTFVKIEDTMVILFSMYNKGEKDTISDQEIKTLIKAALEKL